MAKLKSFVIIGVIALVLGVSGIFIFDPFNSNNSNPINNFEKITFNLEDSIGLATVETSSNPSPSGDPRSSKIASNFIKIDANGNISEIIENKNFNINQFFIGSNGKIYTLFPFPVRIGDLTYLLAEIDNNTGQMKGIDSELTQIEWNSDSYYDKNPSIQFDNQGAIYYKGYSQDNKLVLRKYLNGIYTSFINDNVWLHEFLVLPNGEILIYGQTISTNQCWFRKITTLGSIENILVNDQIQFMKIFPDNRVYIGIWGQEHFGVYRLYENLTLEAKPWIGYTQMNNIISDPYYDINLIEDNSGYGLSMVKKFIFTENAVFGLSTSDQVFIFYPFVAKINSSLKIVTSFNIVGNDLIMAGTTEDYSNKLIKLNLADLSETVLIPNYNIEFYHVNIDALNIIYFDGLDFSSNEYIIGSLNLTSNESIITPTQDNLKLIDFQLLHITSYEVELSLDLVQNSIINDDDDNNDDVEQDIGELKLDFSNTVCIIEIYSSSGTNIKKVLPNGTIADLVISGELRVEKFFIASNNMLYVYPTQRVNGFILLEINMTTGNIKGIESSLSSLRWGDYSYFEKNQPIQVGTDGALYYLGNTYDGILILRKYYNDSFTNIIEDQINYVGFLVLPDNQILIYGTSASNHQRWLRRITTSGSIINIALDVDVKFMEIFPDNRVYIGFWGLEDYHGVYRLYENLTLEAKPWIGYTQINSIISDPYYDVTKFQSSGYGLTNVEKFVNTDNNTIFGLCGNNLYKYFPAAEDCITSITKVNVFASTENDLIIGGTDAANANKLIRYYTSNHSEQNLLPSNNIEVYNMEVSLGKSLYFSGLDYNLNKNVVGVLNLDTLEVNLVQTENNVKVLTLLTI